MLSDDSSKVKYPSFRIDDILNDGFRPNTGEDLQTANKYVEKTDQFDDKFDQPINLSPIKYTKAEMFDSPFSAEKYENLGESHFKKSSVTSSPTLSIGSSDSPSFNHLSPISKSPAIDQLVKYNFSDTNNSSKINLLDSPHCSDESNHNSFSNHNISNALFINQAAYSQSIEDFYLKLNNQFTDKSFASMNYDKPVDYETPLDNMSDSLKKIHQEYQTQRLAKNALLNQFQSSYCPLQKNDSHSTFPAINFAASLNQPSSSFYVQQLYIRMKMLMQAKPRKGGQIRFNHQQTNELEAMFAIKRYLIPSERKQIAKKLSLTERQVKTWFQNRRAKSRRSANYTG